MKFEELFSNTDNKCYLTDKNYSKEVFEYINLPCKPCKEVILKDLSFKNCKTMSGTVQIKKGTIIENVVFDEFNCGDAFHIDAKVNLKNVIFKGRKNPKMIWVRLGLDVSSGDNIINKNECETSLDISEFYKEVWICGLNVDQIKINPNEHVKLKLSNFEGCDWDSLGIAPLSFWKMMVKKIHSEGGAEAVVSMPPKKGKKFISHMKDLKILKQQGLV